MEHHLGRGHRARGEVEEQRVVGARRPRAGRLRVARARAQVVVALASGLRRASPTTITWRSDGALVAHRRELGGGLVVDDGDRGLRALDALRDVARRAERRRRHRDHAVAEHPEQQLVPLGDAREHHERPLAGGDAETLERVGDAARGARELAEA